MAFTPKRIFLADDNENYRSLLSMVLKDDGHEVVVEAKNVYEARNWVPKAVELGIQVAVLDCKMPNEEDGTEIAGALNRAIPQLLVVSISDRWIGMWRDPNYDSGNLHPRNINQFDINCRTPTRGPDFHASRIDFDHRKISAYIGEWQFSMVSREGMETIRALDEMSTRKRDRR